MTKIFVLLKDHYPLHFCDSLEAAKALRENCLNEYCIPDDFERSRFEIVPYFMFTSEDVKLLDVLLEQKKKNLFHFKS